MENIIDWSPNDYSPTYRFSVDDNGSFIRLHKVFNMPPYYDQSEEIQIEQYHIRYMSGDGFEKYKSRFSANE